MLPLPTLVQLRARKHLKALPLSIPPPGSVARVAGQMPMLRRKRLSASSAWLRRLTLLLECRMNL